MGINLDRKIIKIISNSYYLILVQLANFVVPLLSLPILTKVLSVDEFGKVILFYSLMMIAMIFTDYGFHITGPVKIAKILDNNQKLNDFFTNTTVVKFFIACFVSLIAIIFSTLYPEFYFSKSELFLIVIVIFFQSMSFSWFFQGLEKMKFITIINLTSKFLFLGIIIIFSSYMSKALEVFLITSITQFLIAVGYFYFLRKNSIIFDVKEFNYLRCKSIILINFNYFLSRVVVMSYTSFNTIIIGMNEGYKVVAMFGLAEKIYKAILSIMTPITQAIYPYMIKNKNYKLIYIYLFLGLIFLSIFIFLFKFFSEILVAYFFGKAYLYALNYLNYFYILILILFVSMNIGHPFLGAKGHLKAVNYTVYFGCFVFIISNFILGYSVENLMLSLIFAEGCVLISRVILLMVLKEKQEVSL